MLHLNDYQSRVRHFWLYVLRLEHGKYYVGITTNFAVRFRQHGGPQGARWTKLHKPVEVLELHDLGVMKNHHAESIEHDYFEQYRRQYGVRNVRGGRVVSSQPVFRIGPFYFNRYLLDTLVVLGLLIVCSVFIALGG